MENSSKNRQLADILTATREHPNGISSKQLQAALTAPPTTRTLQRRLTELVKAGQLQKLGNGIATRYLVTSEKPVTPAELSPKAKITLSAVSQQIQEHVNQPLHLRESVNYRRSFLDDYQPNQTFYLPLNVREHLKNIGVQPDEKELAGSYAHKILDRLLIDLSWNSSRLEGNTYSLLETERLIERGETVSNKPTFEATMILNHKAAIEFIVNSLSEINFNLYTIYNLHAFLADGLLSNPQASGCIRTIAVGIGKTLYRPLAIPALLKECLQQILQTAQQINDPFEQAFFLMVHLPYLQPFEDINKRTSRLAANIPLLKNNLCPISFIDVPQKTYIDGILGVYELNKVELLADVFVWAYERSALRYSAIKHSVGEPDPMRVKYRMQILDVIHQIITEKLDQTQTIRFIQAWSEANIAAPDQRTFVNLVENELTGLHLGNSARFKVTPETFESWYQQWINE